LAENIENIIKKAVLPKKRSSLVSKISNQTIMQEFMSKKESLEREQIIASHISLDSGKLNLKPVMN
jgi:hypothetical protein